MNDFNLLDELLAKHFSGETLTQEEKAVLEEWKKKCPQEYERIRKLMQTPLDTAVDFDSQRAWNKIAPQLLSGAATAVQEKKIKRIHRFAYSAAATLLLLAALSVFLFWRAKEPAPLLYANDTHHEQRIFLPDSSEVVLYPGGRLTYQHIPERTHRSVSLQGRAFFQVRKLNGTDFTVSAQALQVRVLGTSFLVDAAQASHQTVYVETGKVQVNHLTRQEVLTANEKIEVTSEHFRKSSIRSPEKIFGNRGRILYFNRTPLAEVTQTLKEKSGLIIEFEPGMEENTITSRIDTEKKEEIIAELAFLCRCKYKTLIPGQHYKLHSPQKEK